MKNRYYLDCAPEDSVCLSKGVHRITQSKQVAQSVQWCERKDMNNFAWKTTIIHQKSLFQLIVLFLHFIDHSEANVMMRVTLGTKENIEIHNNKKLCVADLWIFYGGWWHNNNQHAISGSDWHQSLDTKLESEKSKNEILYQMNYRLGPRLHVFYFISPVEKYLFK